MEFRFDKLVKMIQRDMFSTVMLMRILLHYCSTDRSQLAELLKEVAPDELERVYDVLTMFPVTEVGWSVLPSGRATYVTPDMSREDEADVERRQFQEDRSDVEHLRELIRPTVCDK